MSRPTSLRLPEALRTRLDDESRRIASAPSSLAVVLIDEGLKMRRFGGIVFRDGPTGRRAGLASGPDVWEIVRDLKRHGAGASGDPVSVVAEETGLAPELIGLAADYYATFPDEVNDRIAADARAAEEMRALADRRDRMLSA
ncbi:CopG family transcriptional regulator [Candidatus Poriferisodalis sp.]|uniref:CopG family transcriptional regulator n=1 Tax=Candidatus Poriferisodalis sp. TaxID=3101277 RepID=UPI003B02239E